MPLRFHRRTATNRLFFALRLSQTAARQASALTAKWLDQRGVQAKATRPDRLHVTLWKLGDYLNVPDEVVNLALSAGADVEMESFDARFDHAGSVGEHGGLILTGKGGGMTPLHELRKALASRLRRAQGNHAGNPRFQPHITLIYGGNTPWAYVPRQIVEPVEWRVNEFVLIHSLLGKTQHIVLGRWSLQSRQIRLEGF